MEALATVIFERTPQGAVVIKSNGDEVPRRLRTLLLAVDGRSPVAQYVPFLTAFMPLSEKFAELEQLGYLRRKDSQPVQAVPASISTTSPGSYEAGLSDMASLQSSQAPPTDTTVLDTFALELQVLARQMGHAGWQGEAGVHPQANIQVNPRSPVGLPAPVMAPTLQALLHEMEGFLSRAAGLDGLPMVLMLEQITSLAQLRQELPSYLQLIQSYGVDAEMHGQRLDRALALAGH